jgi:hypothetical protein
VSGALPLWLWALTAALLLGGASLTWSMAPFGGGRMEIPVLPDSAASELWDGIAPDAVEVPDPGVGPAEAPPEGDTSGLGAPLVRDTSALGRPLVPDAKRGG